MKNHKIYALIEDDDVVEFRSREDISDKEWQEGDWRVVHDNTVGVDREKYSVSSHFDLELHKRKVVKTHDITPLNTKTRRIISKT